MSRHDATTYEPTIHEISMFLDPRNNVAIAPPGDYPGAGAAAGLGALGGAGLPRRGLRRRLSGARCRRRDVPGGMPGASVQVMIKLPTVTLVFSADLAGAAIANQIAVTDAFWQLGVDIDGVLQTGEQPRAEVVLDISAATELGIAGAGLVYGARRQAPYNCRVSVRARTDVARSLRFITRGSVVVSRA